MAAFPTTAVRQLPARLLVQVGDSDRMHELAAFEVPVDVVAVPADTGDRTRLVIDVKANVDPDALRTAIAQACQQAADALA